MTLPRDRTFQSYESPRIIIRKGPLWIGAGVFLFVPFMVLNIQLFFYTDPEGQADHLVERHHWRPPPSSRVVGESATAKCVRVETTGELLWVTPDQVQIFIVETTTSSPEQPQWWFLPHPNNATKLQIVSGFIQWPPDQISALQDPFRFTTSRTGGDDIDISPWYAAQRVVQEQWGIIPSNIQTMVEYEGAQEGQVAPHARNQWTFWGKIDASIGGEQQEEGGVNNHIYAYLYKVDQPPPPNVEHRMVSIHSLVHAIQEERFSGVATMASLALALSRVGSGDPTILNVPT